MKEARDLAVKAHQGQLYGDLPYTVHLDAVVDVVDECIDECIDRLLKNNLLDEYRNFISELRKALRAAAYLHDLLEDQGWAASYNDLKDKFPDSFPVSIADIVYACTAEKGKNREERFNDKFYLELRNTPYGSVVKGCDRIANMRASHEHKPSMYKKYLTERDDFVIKSMDIIEWEVSLIEQSLLNVVRRKLLKFA